MGDEPQSALRHALIYLPLALGIGFETPRITPRQPALWRYVRRFDLGKTGNLFADRTDVGAVVDVGVEHPTNDWIFAVRTECRGAMNAW